MMVVIKLYRHNVVGLYNLHALACEMVIHGLAALELHTRRRHLLVDIEKLPPEPLHIFIRQLLLLIQEIMHGHFPE